MTADRDPYDQAQDVWMDALLDEERGPIPGWVLMTEEESRAAWAKQAEA